MKISKKDKLYLCVLLFIIIWTSIFIKICLHDRTMLWVDEPGFRNHGVVLFRTLFFERDLGADAWFDEFYNYGYRNPRVGLYIIGGVDIFLDIFVRLSIISNSSKILFLRMASAVFAALSLGCLFYLLEKISGIGVAMVGTVLLFVNPIFRSIDSIVTNDIHMYFFSALSLIALYFFEMLHRRKMFSYLWLLIFAITLGVAVSTKLYAVYVYFAFCLILFKEYKKYSLKRNLGIFLFVSFLVLFIFVLSNPFLYHDTLNGIIKMTTGHVVLPGEELFFSPVNLQYCFTYPYLLFRLTEFKIVGIFYQSGISTSDYYQICIVLGLVARGIYDCIVDKKYLPVFLFCTSFLWLVYPVCMRGADWITPKVFTIMVFPIVHLVSVAIVSLYTQSRNYFK